MNTILRDFPNQNWVTILIILCLTGVAVGKTFYYQQFLDFVKIAGADRYIANRTRGSFFFQPLQLVLLIIQCIGISLLLFVSYAVVNDLRVKDGIDSYLYILIAYTTFELLKFLIERCIGYTMDIYTKMRPFVYKRLNIKNALGVCALFFSAIAIYQKNIASTYIYGFLICIGGCYILSQIWLLSTYRDQFIRFPFYFILYFCTLEIAPYFILYKLVEAW